MTGAIAGTSNYVAVSRRALDLEDYIDVARRHASWIAGPLLAGIVISTIVAFIMPNVYVSQAEMQITPSQVSESIVKSTINQRLNERIIQMEQEILSRTSLSQIIQDPRLDLYKSDRAKEPLEDVIEKMRTQDIHIKIEGGDGTTRGASAFFIAFEYQDKYKAQQTVQALVTKFTDQNTVSQATQTSIVKNLVHDELSEDKAKLDQLNEELTKFRIENSGKLPEQSSRNIAELNSLQQKSSTMNDSLNRLEQEKVQYQTHLQTLESQKQLYSVFDRESSPVASATPELRLLSQKVAALGNAIEQGESSLALLKRTYNPKFPEIRDLETRLDEMRSQRDELQKKFDEQLAKWQEANTTATKEPSLRSKTDFATAQSITNLQGQIDATQTEMKTNEMQRQIVLAQQQKNNRDISVLEAKLDATSAIEAKYGELSANQRAAEEKYQDTQRKQELAEQNSDLLQRKAGENLEVLDVPSLPSQPAKPKRWIIVGAGTAVAFILGLALAGVQEAKDTSLKNLKDVRAYTNLPVLCSIPLLENTMLVRRKRRIAYLGWSAAIIVGMIAVSAALYYHYTTAL